MAQQTDSTPAVQVMPNYQMVKLTLGLFKSWKGYDQQVIVSDTYVYDMLDHPQFTCSQDEVEIEIAVLELWQHLHLSDGANYAQLCEEVARLGFELCPAEVGPAFAVASADPAHEAYVKVRHGSIRHFAVMMEPIVLEGEDDDDGGPWLFEVQLWDDTPVLEKIGGHPYDHLSAPTHILVIQPKQPV